MTQLDHIVIAAQTLEQGVEYVEDILGVTLIYGGRHLKQGTHNKVLRLHDCYLEVIAPDPDSGITPPWFGLGNKKLLKSLQTPRLLTWVARSDDVQTLVQKTHYPVSLQTAQRDALRWQFSFPENGNLIDDGLLPYLIQWESQPAFELLPDVGCSLIRLEGVHPQPEMIRQQLENLDLEDDLHLNHGAHPQLIAYLQTPSGQKILR